MTHVRDDQAVDLASRPPSGGIPCPGPIVDEETPTLVQRQAADLARLLDAAVARITGLPGASTPEPIPDEAIVSRDGDGVDPNAPTLPKASSPFAGKKPDSCGPVAPIERPHEAAPMAPVAKAPPSSPPVVKKVAAKKRSPSVVPGRVRREEDRGEEKAARSRPSKASWIVIGIVASLAAGAGITASEWGKLVGFGPSAPAHAAPHARQAAAAIEPQGSVGSPAEQVCSTAAMAEEEVAGPNATAQHTPGTAQVKGSADPKPGTAPAATGPGSGPDGDH